MKGGDAGSVGLVAPQRAHFPEGLALACGRRLQEFELVYETYGELNADGSNAVLICHALSGHHHAAGYHAANDRKPGWWDVCIGPGKPIDTNHFHVVSLNNIGGCHGSTGPLSRNPETAQAYGPEFPPIRVQPWRHAGHALGAGVSGSPETLCCHRRGVETQRTEHRVQRNCASGDLFRPRLPQRALSRFRCAPPPGPGDRAHGGTHHLSVGSRDGGPIRARSSQGLTGAGRGGGC